MYSVTNRNYAVLTSIGLALGLTVFPGTAGAVDKFEIQVYGPDVGRPGQLGLEAHVNYTPLGRSEPAYVGEQPPQGVTRLTLEPALGVTEYLELGAYLQNMVNADGQVRYAGFKLRTKWVVPERFTGNWFFGINAELGKVPHRAEQHGWANEFRPIVGHYDGHWLFDFNPIFGYALSGPDKFVPDFEPAGKVGFNTQKGFMLGAEYYAGVGELTRKLEPWRRQEHLAFATFDLAAPAGDKSDSDQAWELNLGLGLGLSKDTPQHAIAKAIVGHAF